MALAAKNATIKAFTGAVAFVDEATTTSDNTNYQITNTSKRVWGKTSTITVEDAGVPTIESYTLDRLSGTITFTGAAARTITVTGEYLALSAIGSAYEYEYTLSADNAESTAFTNSYVAREQTIKTIEASLSKFYDISHFFIDKWENDTDFVLEFYSVSTSDPDIRAWVKISSDNPSAAVDGLVEESIDFEGTTDDDGNCVSFGTF